jgi:predicted GIY-YIG superfamily endonuclease
MLGEKLEWTNWKPLCNLKFDEIPNEPGIYEVRWAIDGKPQPINRVDGVDDQGLLYIGVSLNLQLRIKNFLRRIKGGKAPHTAGHTYVAFNFERKFKSENLEIRWSLLSKEELKNAESKLLEEYVKKFLDKPPLNLVIVRKRLT